MTKRTESLKGTFLLVDSSTVVWEGYCGAEDWTNRGRRGHTLLRYVEANPLRAKLVERARDWRWASLAIRCTGKPAGLLDRFPLDLPSDWDRVVQARWEQEELKTLRTCVVRGRPFGDAQWVDQMAKKLGLEFTLRSRGRPKKAISSGGDGGK